MSLTKFCQADQVILCFQGSEVRLLSPNWQSYGHVHTWDDSYQIVYICSTDSFRHSYKFSLKRRVYVSKLSVLS